MDTAQRRLGFAKRFNAALQASGKARLSDGELLKLLGRHGVAVTTQTVSNWRNGKHMPKLEQIEGLASTLDMDPGELAFGKPRIGESRAVWRAEASDDRVLAEGLTLLEKDEWALVRDLVQLLNRRRTGARPGRRKRG
ncbi:MAG: hypothetical protein QM601_12185 [Pseudoxanthomonas sp.]